MAYVDDGPGPKLWVIFDPARGLFWRDAGIGYTASVVEAGLFSERFASQMTGPPYTDRHEQARHLASFGDMLRDAKVRADALAERFALLESAQE